MQEGVEQGFPAGKPTMGSEAEGESAIFASDNAGEPPVDSIAEKQAEVVEKEEIIAEEMREQEEHIAEPAIGKAASSDNAPTVTQASVSESLASEGVRLRETIPPPTRPGLIEHAAGEPVANADTMEKLLQEEYAYHQPQRGEVLYGFVVSMSPEEIIVDVGLKREGIVPSSDFARVDKKTLSEIHVGDKIPVYVLRPRDRDGNLLLSLSRGLAEADWIRAQEMMDNGTIYEGKVSAHNKGGLVIPFGKIRGFLPASQVVGIPRRLSEEAKEARLEKMVNQTLPLKVVEVDRRRRRLIFSHRAAWWKWKEMQRNQLLESLHEGDVRKGVVSSIRDFGAFVDLGGAEGLIHVSELAWRRIQHPREVLKVGDEVEVYVLGVDKEQKRIALSLKRLKPEPWSQINELYHLDQLVEGVVTRVTDFGAFVRIADGIEGLIHKSELADIEPKRPSDLVKEGDLLLLRIIRIDQRRRRIGLSLRQVTEEEWATWAATFRTPEELAAPLQEASATAKAESPATEESSVTATHPEPAEEVAQS